MRHEPINMGLALPPTRPGRHLPPPELAAGPARLPRGLAAYFVVSESLANLNRHSGATAGAVEARVVDGVLHVRVNDNGIGGASTAKGHGLAGLVEHLSGVDGRLALTSPAGGPTTVEAMIPCAF